MIESPSSLDLLDDRTEGRVLKETLKIAGIPYWYSLVSDRRMIQEALGNRLLEACRYHNKLPILHLSMHGSEEGVTLTNDEFISWSDLREELLPLIRAMDGSLLVCMSSCFGTSGCRMAMYEDDEPHFWALVGNSESALWSDAAIAYASFYHLFFKGLKIEVCVESMKVASGDHNFMLFMGDKMKAYWETYVKERRQELVQNVERAADETIRKSRT